MCGRFGLFSSIELIKKMMQLDDMPLLSPRYNIAPSQPVAGVRAKKKCTGTGDDSLPLGTHSILV